MSYNGIILRKSISISKIYSIHYFEYMSDFSFEGESKDYWEYLGVVHGEVIVTSEQPERLPLTWSSFPSAVRTKQWHFSEGRHSRSTKQNAISLPISSARQDAASTAGWMTHTCRTCQERNRSCSAPNS